MLLMVKMAELCTLYVICLCPYYANDCSKVNAFS